MASTSISQPRLSLVKSVSQETVNTLENLLEGARSGEIVGMAFCVLLNGRRHFVSLAGEARRDLTSTRGMVCNLDDEIARLISDQADAAETLRGFD